MWQTAPEDDDREAQAEQRKMMTLPEPTAHGRLDGVHHNGW